MVVPDAVLREFRPPEGFASPPPAAVHSPLGAVTPPIPSPRSEFKIGGGVVVKSTLPSPPHLDLSQLNNVNSSLDSEVEDPATLTPPNEEDDSPDDEDDDEEEEELQGQTMVAHSGLTIDRASAAFGPRAAADSEAEDEFGYTSLKIQRKYGRLAGDVHYIRLNKGTQGLGISLAGHKDRLQMAVIVAGLNPAGNAYRDGNMKVTCRPWLVFNRILRSCCEIEGIMALILT